MLNPNVGEIVSISSPLNLFRIVVLPALSNPLKMKSYYYPRRDNQEINEEIST